MTRKRSLALAALLCTCTGAAAQPSQPRFYAPFDTHARGVLLPENVGFESPNEFERVPGVVGGAAATKEAR